MSTVTLSFPTGPGAPGTVRCAQCLTDIPIGDFRSHFESQHPLMATVWARLDARVAAAKAAGTKAA